MQLSALPPASLPGADRRSDEILASLRGIFAQKGFDGASMQDLARAAGMSVGNFYRYFPSKAAIVVAMVSRDMAEVAENFAAVLKDADPLVALRRKLEERISLEACAEDGPLWAEMSAAAFRMPEIAAAMIGMEAALRSQMLVVFAEATGLTLAEAETRFAAHAALIILLVKASMMVCQSVATRQPEMAGLVLRMIDGLLAEVGQATAKA